MSELLDIARRYVRAGLSVIPIVESGGKLPNNRLLLPGLDSYYAANDERAAWREYTRRMPTDQELVAWFRDTDAGIGIVGGAISGGLVRIDFEHAACLPTWRALLREQDAALRLAASNLPVVQTGKGWHVYFRMSDPPGHQLLSSRGEGSDMIVLAETQGEGCYCVAPPSVGYHPDYSTFTYAWANGDARAIPTLDQKIATALLDAARFPGFWDPVFAARWGITYGSLHRVGLTLMDTPEGGRCNRCLGWEHLKALRAYLARYDALLRAVETAPPPPPSYVDGDDERYDE